MSTIANCTYEIIGWEELPSPPDAQPTDGPSLARYEVKKRFQGDFEGDSTAERLMYVPNKDESSTGTGHVTIEQLTGLLNGLSGSFVIQHGGLVVAQGIQQSYGHVVPESGTEELEGIRGVVEISISSAGVHALKLDYLFHRENDGSE